MSENWLPIETAPKDGTRIRLGFDKPLVKGITQVYGKWTDDRYSKDPVPHWTNDLKHILGGSRTREIQPKWWKPADKPQGET